MLKGWIGLWKGYNIIMKDKLLETAVELAGESSLLHGAHQGWVLEETLRYSWLTLFELRSKLLLQLLL